LCYYIFFFPWFDAILGWFLFGGLISIAKFGCLVTVVISRSNYGFLYALIDEQLIGMLKPSIEKCLVYTEVFRKKCCNFIVMFTTTILQSLVSLCINEMSDVHLSQLKTMLSETMKKIENKTK